MKKFMMIVLLFSLHVSTSWSSVQQSEKEEGDLRRRRDTKDGESVTGATVDEAEVDMGTAPPIETGEAVGPTLGAILRKGFNLLIILFG